MSAVRRWAVDATAAEAIRAQTFDGGTVLAGFLLVFLGYAAGDFGSFAPQEQRAVRTKYRLRAGSALLGILLSLLAACASIAARLGHDPAWWITAALVLLALAGLLAVVAAFAVVADLR